MSDVVDDIETIAACEIAELRRLRELPDARLTDDTLGRIRALLEIVTVARREQREQRKWVSKLPQEELDRLLEGGPR